MKIKCYRCGETFDIPVTQEQLDKWKQGVLIQDAMPNLAPWQRELMISHTCNDCWESMFPPEDEAQFS